MQADPHTTRSIDSALSGDSGARRQLLDQVYDDLRRIASSLMKGERAGHTLQPTALAHEVYLRILDPFPESIESEAELLSTAARVMRHLLIDHARSKGAAKRGGSWHRVPMDAEMAQAWEDPERVLALDEALERLARTQARQAEVVELLFFGGLTQERAAEVLRVSRDTVKLDWRFARAWLHRELGAAGGASD